MSKLLFSLIFALSLTACDDGSKTSSSPTCDNFQFIGTWYNSSSTTDTLTINPGCTATTSYCEQELSFTFPDSNGLIQLTIHSANLNGGCMQPQTVTCEIGLLDGYPDNDPRLGLDCGTTNQFMFQTWQ